MSEHSTESEALVVELRRVLQHLYDPGELSKSALLEPLGLRAHRNPVPALRRILTNAIQALKPGADVPMHSNAWRLYHVLLWRYVEGSRQNDVAANLAISPRQLRRLEWEAVRVLAGYMRTRYKVGPAAHGAGSEPSPIQEFGGAQDAEPARAETPDREQELKWLQESFPSGIADTAEMIAASLKTVTPLANASNTCVACHMADDLPPIAGQLAALRQALTNLLSAAIHAVPGGEIEVTVETERKEIQVRVRATGDPEATPEPGAGISDHLEMARQFADLFGGALTTCPQETQATRGMALLLSLPVADQTPVLFIDDNADTLQLLRRYLSGTQYRFLGTRAPEQALALTQEFAPRIIVLDIMLPGIDGWELLGRLREHPDTESVPILVCTILPQDKLAMTLGAAGFVRKPVSREALLDALNQQMALTGSRSAP
jgi:CheY-like chemotaxis protein